MARLEGGFDRAPPLSVVCSAGGECRPFANLVAGALQDQVARLERAINLHQFAGRYPATDCHPLGFALLRSNDEGSGEDQPEDHQRRGAVAAVWRPGGPDSCEIAAREVIETEDTSRAGTRLPADEKARMLAEAAKLRSKNMYPAFLVDLNCVLRGK